MGGNLNLYRDDPISEQVLARPVFAKGYQWARVGHAKTGTDNTVVMDSG